MAAEFIENPNEEYDKQDCELRAFHRLAAKIKQAFPRTPRCLLLDAIYAGQPVFDRCRETKNDETTNSVRLTNFRVDYEGVATLLGIFQK